MMGEIVARNMQSKAIAENKNAIVASCWTYFTTGDRNWENIKNCCTVLMHLKFFIFSMAELFRLLQVVLMESNSEARYHCTYFIPSGSVSYYWCTNYFTVTVSLKIPALLYI